MTFQAASVESPIFGNVGTLITFRLGAEDTQYLARHQWTTSRTAAAWGIF